MFIRIYTRALLCVHFAVGGCHLHVAPLDHDELRGLGHHALLFLACGGLIRGGRRACAARRACRRASLWADCGSVSANCIALSLFASRAYATDCALVSFSGAITGYCAWSERAPRERESSSVFAPVPTTVAELVPEVCAGKHFAAVTLLFGHSQDGAKIGGSDPT